VPNSKKRRRKMGNHTRIFLLGIIFLALIVPNYVLAENKLAWDAPTTGGEVETYSVYWRTPEGTYSDDNKKDNITETECLFNDLGSLQEKETYYFVVRAKNSAGESGDSNEVSWMVPDTTAPDPVQGVEAQ
jgi:hypothetical protein